MNNINVRKYASPCGTLLLGSYKDRLCLCDWQTGKNHESALRRIKHFFKAEFENGRSGILDLAERQLDEYFAAQRNRFEIPVHLAGTDFQNKVWGKLLTIPYGKTVSYIGMARNMGCPSSVRALANAVGANPVSIIIPCHRVIGSDGSLTGFGGGLETKQYLLSLEKATVYHGERVISE